MNYQSASVSRMGPSVPPAAAGPAPFLSLESGQPESGDALLQGVPPPPLAVLDVERLVEETARLRRQVV